MSEVDRNVEVKVRVADASSVAARAEALSGGGPEVIAQRDVFFAASRGRLKLRVAHPGRAELIAYERPDTLGLRTSRYILAPVDDPGPVETALTAALGTLGVVAKVRRLYLVGRTRIHLDEVEGLGTFLELEVVLADGEGEAAGQAEAEHLLERLGLAAAETVGGAYLDLLAGSSSGAPG